MFIFDNCLLAGFEHSHFRELAFSDVDRLSNDAMRFAVLVSQDDAAIVKVEVAAIFMAHPVFGFENIVRQLVEIFDCLIFGHQKIFGMSQSFPRFPGPSDLAGPVAEHLPKVLAAHDRVRFQIPVIVETF